MCFDYVPDHLIKQVQYLVETSSMGRFEVLSKEFLSTLRKQAFLMVPILFPEQSVFWIGVTAQVTSLHYRCPLFLIYLPCFKAVYGWNSGQGSILHLYPTYNSNERVWRPLTTLPKALNVWPVKNGSDSPSEVSTNGLEIVWIDKRSTLSAQTVLLLCHPKP